MHFKNDIDIDIYIATVVPSELRIARLPYSSL